MTYTNEGLVKFVISLMSMPRGTVYILGGIGRVLTEHMIQGRIKRGCAHTIRNQNTIRAKIGNYAYDCNAIIKCYLWQTAPGVINYNRPVGSDLGSTQLYNLSREKGVMSTMPDVVDLRKRMKRVFDMNEVEYTKWQELVEDWKFKELDGVNKAFDEQNNFQTSVRGVKVRGVYNTYEEANVRSKVLQRLDSRFDVFVGQVGYWLAWHPDSNKIENCEYLNEDLNTLMKEYKNNEAKRDMFYQEQTRQRTQEAREQTERMKKQLEEERAKQDAKPVTEAQTDTGLVASESTPEVAADALADSLTGMDPWMQRKMQQAGSESS